MHINDLLKVAIDQGASDLHLKVGSHPVIRVDGQLRSLPEQKRLMQEDTIAMAIDPLIDAGLDDEHRRLLSYAVVGMAEGASRHWIQGGRQSVSHQVPPEVSRPDGALEIDGALEPARRMAARVADLAWAGLRSVHAD